MRGADLGAGEGPAPRWPLCGYLAAVTPIGL